MFKNRDEIRDDLVALLRAGRELSPDADRELAESFLTGLDRDSTSRPRRRPFPQLLVALLFAVAALGFGVRLLATEYGPTSHIATLSTTYPSAHAARQDIRAIAQPHVRASAQRPVTAAGSPRASAVAAPSAHAVAGLRASAASGSPAILGRSGTTQR
jgi:hypothetical protein